MSNIVYIDSQLADIARLLAKLGAQQNPLASITGATSATITGILVGDINNSWVIPA